MATYNVIAKAFYNGMLYSPKHASRNVLVTDEKFDPVPSWLEKVDGRKVAVKGKAAQHSAKQEAVVQDQKAVDNGVETL